LSSLQRAVMVPK